MRNFKSLVLSIVKEIPKGKVMSYKEVAAKAGSPNASRAVGNIMKGNHDKSVPCHRVIRSNGDIGGYNGGVEKKLKLLKEEGYIV